MQEEIPLENNMHTGPKVFEAKKAQKTVSPVNQIQKKIIGRILRPIGRIPIKNLGLVLLVKTGRKAPKTATLAPKLTLTEEEKEQRRQMDEQILADMRIRNQVDRDNFEASRLSKNFLDTFVVRNAYLNQNLMFIKGNREEGSSRSVMTGATPQREPLDSTMTNKILRISEKFEGWDICLWFVLGL
ncbi:hypothetical protein PIB30_068113 [Stylosanthes scabra]|uniref:Uncharacterized protein n=1 Tax=Stylosanthes scabra TaxID=79078 RepID=A0ABU6QMC8_9FABA|nr:hypothetical protein [Stylosanthes scabra]